MATDLSETRPFVSKVESALSARLPAIRGDDGPTMGLGEGINRNGTSAATIDAALRATVEVVRQVFQHGCMHDGKVAATGDSVLRPTEWLWGQRSPISGVQVNQRAL